MNGPTQRAPIYSDSSSANQRLDPAPPRRSKSRRTAPELKPLADESGDRSRPASWPFRNLGDAPGWVCSLLVHAALLIILALITVTHQFRDRLPEILAVLGEREQAPVAEELETTLQPIEVAAEDSSLESFDAQDLVSSLSVPVPLEETPQEPILVSTKTDLISLESIPSVGSPEFSGRTGAGKAALIAREGGTPESEAAVALGLQWLANHQNRNGSWSFNHTTRQCRGQCSHPGSLNNCTTGATGLALLCFLGAGHSDQTGEYKSTVLRGLKYLLSQMKSSNRDTGNLMGRTARRGRRGGNEGMYAQGIATLALCEAYNLGHSNFLRKPTQEALNFIVRAQDTSGGGWRYNPGDPGDTSVVGWQVMALYSGRIAEMDVPQQTFDGAWAFLDSVQSDEGVGYGYRRPGATPTLSAVGLLSRMYLGKQHGWDPTNPVVKLGANRLSALGPSARDMYYNYYATQFMYQVGGDTWISWNNELRDQLVAKQDKKGHAAGSWLPTCPHGSRPGGRLYMTAMSILTLEVYYRHLPIYARSGDIPADGGDRPIDF